MKWIACLALLVGCQADAKQTAPAKQDTRIIQLPKAQVTDAYRADIEALCDCVKRSGADQKPKEERWPLIAMWLGPQIKTNEGHEYLIAIQPLQGEAKALALETEAKRVGLTQCDLANEWR